MQDNSERIGRAHLDQTGRQLIGRPHLQDKPETSRWQVGNKIWKTTGRQLGNNGVTNGRHLETIGRLILGDQWDSWKAIGRQSGDHIWETSGGQLVTRQQKPWNVTQIGRKMKRDKWRDAPESRPPPARLGNKSRETREEKHQESQAPTARRETNEGEKGTPTVNSLGKKWWIWVLGPGSCSRANSLSFLRFT